MSQYLSIYKGNTYLFSFSRSTQVYQAFGLSYTSGKTELTKQDIDAALSKINNSLQDIEQDINDEQQALKYIKSAQDIRESVGYIRELKESKEEKERAQGVIILICQMFEECSYGEGNEEEKKLYYSID